MAMEVTPASKKRRDFYFSFFDVLVTLDAIMVNVDGYRHSNSLLIHNSIHLPCQVPEIDRTVSVLHLPLT